jgi:hypothetical protein
MVDYMIDYKSQLCKNSRVGKGATPPRTYSVTDIIYLEKNIVISTIQWSIKKSFYNIFTKDIVFCLLF